MKKIYLSVLFLMATLISFSQNPLLVKDIYPGLTGSSIQQIVKTTNYTFFNAEDDDADANRGLYRTDGTTAGTIKLNLSYPTYISTKADFLTPLNDKVIFVGDNSAGYFEIWSNDGNQAGTVALERFQPSNGYQMRAWSIAAMSGYVYYGVITNDLHVQLRRTNGTAAGTGLVKDFGVTTNADFSLALFQVINNVLYFDYYQQDGTDNLWRSDGTEAGTQLVKQIPVDAGMSSYFMQAGSNFYFFVGAAGSSALWKSDGTTAGTAPLKTIGTVPNGNTYPSFVNIGSTLYFAANDNINGKEFWITDGTVAGTVMVADINPGAAASNPTGLTILNNNIYFSALSATEGIELRKYDGSTVSLVKDVNPGSLSSGPSSIVVSNNTILFSAGNPTVGGELWITDGTTQNTVMVADINPGSASAGVSLITPGNPVYFSAGNGVNGPELFTYDNSDGIAGLRKIFVNDNSTSGDVFTSAVGNNGNSGSRSKPFATINYAISKAYPGDTIVIDAGMYAENITVNKSLTIRGAKTGNCPGASLNRGDETIILPPTTNLAAGSVFTITAADVKLDGLTIDGDNPSLTSNYNMNGADVDGFSAITNNTAGAGNMQVVNCIIKNFNRNGVGMSNNVSGINISCNHIDNLARIVGTQGIFADARAVNMFGNNYGTITNNYFTRVSTGIIISSANTAATTTPVISDNTISSYTTGILLQGNAGNGTPYDLTGNTITTADYAAWNVTGQTKPSVNSNYGIRVSGTTFNNTSNINNNNVSGCYYGILATGITSVSGGLNFTNNNLSNNNNGMNISQVSAPGNINISSGNISGSPVGVFYTAGVTTNAKLFLDGVSLSNNTVGLDASYVSGNALPLQFNNTTISGGTTGLRLYGNVTVPAGTLAGLAFSGQSTNYIQLTNYTFQGQVIDATAITFDGLTGSAMTLAQRFAAENKIIHQVDYNGGGFIRIKSGEVFVTPQSYVSTAPADWGAPTSTASVQRAIVPAVAGDIVNIAAGTYTEQLTIDKALTLKGEGAGQSIIARGATGVLTKLPGLSEAGIIQSTVVTGDIIIQDLTVDGSNGSSSASGPHHAIMLQASGAIRNCEITNMKIMGQGSQEGNGIYVSYTGADPRTFEITNNDLHDFTWVGMNVQGNNLTVALTNNNINATGAPYGMPLAIGGWGSTLSGLTLTNNLVSNYNGFGLSVGSNNALINNNSFTPAGSVSAIINNGPLVNASCNWFGSAEAEFIQPKISGSVTYSPWLNNGTDNNVAIGFQPLPGACNGRQNKFYVNNNSQVGDVFTTAVGNNSNNGFSSAPFATIPYAYSVAQAGDSIFVDAGTYDLGGLTYSFPKAITLLGSNYQVSPNDPLNKLLANSGRNSESIITNGIITIASSNLRFKGFTLDLGDHRAIELNNSAGTNNDYGNFLFEKNIFKINVTALFNQFNITGKLVTSPALPVTSGYTITDNLFEKSGTISGTTFNMNYVKDIFITNNSFVATGTGRQLISNLGTTGIVDNYVFQNNVAETAGIVANCTLVSTAVISNNILNNCDRGINLLGSMPQPSTIEFSNNFMEQTAGGTPFLGYNRGGTSNNASHVFKVENNTLIATRHPTLPNQLYGFINFTVLNSLPNNSFIIRGNKITLNGDFTTIPSDQVRPVTVRGRIGNLTFTGNEITLNNSGTFSAAIVLPPAPAVTINTEFGSGANLASNAVINIQDNKIQNYKQSVVFYDNNSGTGSFNSFIGYGNIPTGASVNINNNSFTGDSISINNGTSGESINANCNWYGFTASHQVAAKVTEATVNNAPWLTNGTDIDAATGFQSIANVCNGVPVDADIITVTNVTCNGAANGSINVLVEGGLAPFTFAWSKDDVAGFSTSEDLSNLAPGEYKLIITDANGSVDSVFADITEPEILTASGSGTNNLCYGESLGTADVSVGGGTLPYTYLWNNGATTENISGLAAGIYTVTVTDANGCTANASYEVTHPSIVTASISGSSSSCANTATVTAGGGTPGYTYLWSNGATTATITSVPSGIYSVTVTDANGCVATAQVTLTANEAFNPAAQVTDVTCYNATNGSITVTNVNAVAPFTYSIDGLNFQTSATFNNLSAGTYTVTVVDKNGCTGFVTKTINRPPQLSVVLNTVQSTCFGSNTGAVTITATGGTGALSYAWTGPGGFTSGQRNINNLAAGNYSLTVTDNNSCAVTLNAVVPVFNQVTVTPQVINIACKGEINGRINLTVSGGTGSGFTYLWNNGAVTKDIMNLGVGNYNVTITDVGSGCVEQRSFTITQPASIIGLSFTKTNATGCNSLGTITGTGTGGTMPYQFKLNNGNYQASNTFTGLYAGNYTLTVMDANGCTRSSAIISITDNGGDQYESNNSKNQASADTIGKIVNARLAVSTDIADWFKFTTPAGNRNYTVTLSHPTVNFNFIVYPAGNNTAPLVPVSSATGSKTYFLNGNAVYYISITGTTLSYNCYTLVVNPTALPIARTSGTTETAPASPVEYAKAVEVSQQLSANVFPNPHHGVFNLVIHSPRSGMAGIELYNAAGQKVITRRVMVNAGNNTVNFVNIKESLLLYKVMIGTEYVSGKIIGPQ
jgi:ELWxxDGT repeat protein